MHNRRTRASGPVLGCCDFHILLLYSIILSHLWDCQGADLYDIAKYFSNITLNIYDSNRIRPPRYASQRKY